MKSTMKKINDILRAHPFFKDCTDDEVHLISQCGEHRAFEKNNFLAKENNKADVFYLIIKGRVAICTTTPNKKNNTIQTISDEEMFGWSWLFPPYQWMFDAIALDKTSTITLNGDCLKQKIENDSALGYKLMKQFSLMIIQRLNATRLQLLDIYGSQTQ